MIKVLIVVKSLEVTGVSNVIFSYYRNIDHSKIQMDFACCGKIIDSYKQEILLNKSKIYFVKNRDSNPIHYILELSRIVRKNNYKIIHAHGNSAMLAVELFSGFIGGAKIRIAHSHNTTCDHLKVEKLFRPLFNLMCNYRIACGEEAGMWLYRDQKFKVLKNGMYLEKYVFSDEIRDTVRKELGVSNKHVIGHVGAFNYQKNQEFLIDIFKEYLDRDPDSVLLLVGMGDDFDKIKTKVLKLGIEDHVILYGLSNQISNLMMAMDVFVLPSRFEGLPCVLVEAQATGLACVVSKNVSEETNLTGLVQFVSLDDSIDIWNNKIKEILKSDNERAKRCETAQMRLMNMGYNIKNSALELEQIYSDALKN